MPQNNLPKGKPRTKNFTTEISGKFALHDSSSPRSDKRRILVRGKLGEDLAATFLKNKGYRIIARNFHSRTGEIDIIATHKEILVFIEVKTRFGNSFGRPEEAVTPWKIRAIISAANYFKLLHPELPEALQIDVVAVELDANDRLKKMTHLENVTS